MDIRGQRECQACGNRWSYYETGEISCPECESVRSVGIDDRTTHTASTAELDLTSILADIDEVALYTIADRAADASRTYCKSVGFIHAGELQPLSETYLAACELRRVGATLGRVMDPTDAETQYFFELLQGAETGDRPAPEDVPKSLHPERGLAVAAAVRAYLTDLRSYRDNREEAVEGVLSSVTTQRKRIEALDGDVDPQEAEELVRALRDLSEYLRANDETALSRALDRVDTEQL